MNLGAVQRLAQNLARQTREKKVNRGGAQRDPQCVDSGPAESTKHDITRHHMELQESFFLSFFFIIAILYTLHTPKISSPTQSTSYI
jgi:hypothetical protein